MASHHLNDLSTDALERLEAAVERFEQALNNGHPADLTAWLPHDPIERKATLIELIHVELELKLRKREAIRVEQYLKQFAELRKERRAVLDLLVKEYRFRRPHEPGLSASEYERRFPTLKLELVARLESEMETVAGAAPERTVIGASSPLPRRTLAEMVRELSESPLLDLEQRRELAAGLQPPPGDAQSLLAELTRRGWLTAYQADRLLQGRGAELHLGQYIVLDRLGEGGMGQVFKAKHQVMKRLVAVKVIRKGLLSYGEQVQRFYREIEAVARLSHPNIVLAHDAGRVGDVHFFAMEYVEGIDLARQLRDTGPVPVDKACDYVRQAALGLQHAHERGLVHRDIKPSNLLVCPGENGAEIVKILDLGLARIHESNNRRRLTQVGEVMGTADYIAPEQANDASGVDIRADIYSLGCTLYHLIAGQPVFVGGSMTDKLRRHQKEVPRPLGQIRNLPAGLDAALTKMLAKRPEERYQSPKEVAEALGPICGLVTPAKTVAPTPPTTLAEPAAALPKTAVGRRRSRRRLMLGSAALATAAIFLAVSIPLLRRGPASGNGEDKIIPPPVIPTGAPMSLHALVATPAKLPGVKSWTVETKGHRGIIADAKMSHDGKWLATGGHDGTIRIWNADDEFKLHRVLIDEFPVGEVAWSPDGNYLATVTALVMQYGSAGQISVWDLARGTGWSLPWKNQIVVSLAWSPDSQQLVICGYRGETWLITVHGRIIDQGKLGNRCEFIDNKTLAAILPKNNMPFLNVGTLDESREFKLPAAAFKSDAYGRIAQCAWSRGGDRLAEVNEQYFRVFDAKTGKPLAENKKPAIDKSERRRVAWSAYGKRCAVATMSTTQAGEYIEIVDADSAALQSSTDVLSLQQVTAMAWTRQGDKLIAATRGINVTGATGIQMFQLDKLGIGKTPWPPFGSSAPQEWDTWLAFGKDNEPSPVSRLGQRVREWGRRSPDGTMAIIFSAGAQGSALHRYDLLAKPESSLQLAAPLDGNSALGWSHDSQLVLVGEFAGGARIIEARTGREMHVINEGRGKTNISGVALSPDQQTLALANVHGVFWYDVPSNKLTRSRQDIGAWRIAYSFDGTLFAAAKPDKVNVWDAVDVVTNEKAEPLASLSTPGYTIELAFSHDNTILATAGNTAPHGYLPAVVRFWDPRTGRPLGCVHTLEGNKGLAVSAEGHVRVTGSKEERELVYIAETERGQETMTFDEFKQRFGWTNDRARATLDGAVKVRQPQGK